MTCDDAQKIAEEIVAKYEDDLDVIGSKPHGEDDPCYLHCEKTLPADNAMAKLTIQNMIGSVMAKLPKKPDRIWNGKFPPGEKVSHSEVRIIGKKVDLKLTYTSLALPKNAADLLVKVDYFYYRD